MLELVLVKSIRGLPFVALGSLLIWFIPWPFISLSLVFYLFSAHFFPTQLQPEDIYLPRLPTEVYAHIASFLPHRHDLVRFTFAGRITYNAGNPILYQKIIMDEHPSPRVPWFRRRLFRLHDCLTVANALQVCYADFSCYTDIDEEYLLSILAKCRRITTLILPAMQQSLEGFTPRRNNVIIKQPCFLSAQLSMPIYNSVTSLTWIGPFIPLRGPERRHGSNGREMLLLFPNLRSLTIRFRPDHYTSEGDPGICHNVYGNTKIDVDDFTDDLTSIASYCRYIEEIVVPFWEPVYSLVSRSLFETFEHLRRIKFLAIDSPARWASDGTGLLKFIVEMHEIGIDVSFENPYQTHFGIQSLLDEINLAEDSGDRIRELSKRIELGFSTGPLFARHDYDLLNRLEWINPSTIVDNAQMTLCWGITPRLDHRFFVPPIFTGVQFEFDKNVRRYDASSFLKFQRCMTEAVETPHVRKIGMDMRYVNVFYLAFPLFMQFYGKRVLTLRLERLVLPATKGWETCWLRRRWRLRRERDGNEEEVALEDLGKDGIHVHPTRCFERIMLGMLFCGERNIQEITCNFHDRYQPNVF